MDKLYAVGEYKVGLKKEIVYDREILQGSVIAQWKHLKRKQITHLYVRIYVEEGYEYRTCWINYNIWF